MFVVNFSKNSNSYLGHHRASYESSEMKKNLKALPVVPLFTHKRSATIDVIRYSLDVFIKVKEMLWCCRHICFML